MSFSYSNTVWIGDYVKITVTESTSFYKTQDNYFSMNYDCNYNIEGNNLDFSHIYSDGYFFLNTRSKELGIKLKGLIKEGEIYINSSFEYISIKICVEEIENDDEEYNMLIEINIYYLKKRNDNEDEQKNIKKMMILIVPMLKKVLKLGVLQMLHFYYIRLLKEE